MKSIIRRIYHRVRWAAFQGMTLGRAGNVQQLDPSGIVFGQLPSSQFPRRARRFVTDGEWDREVIAIEDHSVYRSMVAHFIDGRPWEETPHYREAMEQLAVGNGFRGEESKDEVLEFFKDWDELYQRIKSSGFLSMREQLARRLIDNPCKRLDEITINLARDGQPILNDGWHRFCIARILNVTPIPVRILARHSCYDRWIPSGGGGGKHLSTNGKN